MGKAKKIFDISVLILTLIALVCLCFFIYYKSNFNDVVLETTYVNNGIGTGAIADELEEAGLDNPPAIEFQLFSADSGNGDYLAEMKVSFFSDYLASSNGIYQAGCQTRNKETFSFPRDVDFWDGIGIKDMVTDTYSDIFSRFSDYNAYSKDEVTKGAWQDDYGLKQMHSDENFAFVITIEGKPYLLKMNKRYWVYTKVLDKRITVAEVPYCFADLFYYLQDVITSFSKGYGEYIIPVDLSTFFSVYSYNESTGRFNDEQDAKYIIEKIYIPVKFNYDYNGYTESSQSLFGTIDYNRDVDNSSFEDLDIWKIQQIYDIDKSNFTLQYSAVHEGYLLSLNLNDLKDIDLTKVKLRCVINFRDFDKSIVGLNYLCFDGLPLDYLKIESDSLHNFYFLKNSITNTELNQVTFVNINAVYLAGSNDFGGGT